IVSLLRKETAENEFVSVLKQSRDTYAQHPWSIGGGGASELKVLLDSKTTKTLLDFVAEVGFAAVTREDDAYLVGTKVAKRQRIPHEQIKLMIEGEVVRDWALQAPRSGIWPYSE